MSRLYPGLVFGQLSNEAIIDCAQRARQTARSMRDFENYEGDSGLAWRRYFVGYLGEEFFAAELRKRSISFENPKSNRRTSLGADFLIDRPRLRIEVKNAAENNRERLIIGTARRMDFDVLVQTRNAGFWTDEGRYALCGWTTPEAIRRFPVEQFRGSPCFTERFEKALRPIGELFERLERR